MYINSLADLKKAINHPYRSGEYLSDETQIFEVTDDDNEMAGLIESYDADGLFYAINWEDNTLFTEDGTQIESVY